MDDVRERFQNLHEFLKAARFNLNRNNWDYIIGGTETETTLARNRQSLNSIAFRPRVLRNVRTVDCSVRAVRPQGAPAGADRAGRRAAEFLGRAASRRWREARRRVRRPDDAELGDRAGAGGDREGSAPTADKIFQLYVRGDDEFVDDHLRRAVAATGYVPQFCLTVDLAHY